MTSQSAEAVGSRDQDAPVLDEVVALVDKSLVQFDDTNNRYRLLESVRDYAAAKLLARGDTAAKAVHAAHRDYYLGLAETAAPHLIGHGQADWLDRLQLELDNLRAAISECATDPDPEPGLRLAHALQYFWAYREPRVEGAHAVCAALDRVDAQAPTLATRPSPSRRSDNYWQTSPASTTRLRPAAGKHSLSLARCSDERLRAEALFRLLAYHRVPRKRGRPRGTRRRGGVRRSSGGRPPLDRTDPLQMRRLPRVCHMMSACAPSKRVSCSRGRRGTKC